MTLAPLEIVSDPECRQLKPTSEIVQCPECSTHVRGSAVVNDDVRKDFKVRGHVITRRFYCPHCSHIVWWQETASADGTPAGTLVLGPGISRDRRRVFQFLNAFPEAAGVLQR